MLLGAAIAVRSGLNDDPSRTWTRVAVSETARCFLGVFHRDTRGSGS
jgi:hypothetical protein